MLILKSVPFAWRKLWMLCVNGKVDESGQIRLLTFRDNSSRRMRELGSSFCIIIVVLDVS
jgi:hypothetical protein